MARIPSPSELFWITEMGTPFAPSMTNTWGAQINDELLFLEKVIDEVCTPEQSNQIAERLKAAPKGIILYGR
jgi:hypothetical protein